MDKSALFIHLSTQDSATLLDLLSKAYDHLDHDQRRWVFGELAETLPPRSVDGEKLLAEIEQFQKESLAGAYYAPFNINSKNYMHIPAETEDWFEELSDFLKAATQLTQQGDHLQAVACFKILYQLIDTMEQGEEIVFADELGSWMIQGDQKAYVAAYLSSLAAIATPEEFAATAAWLIKRDSYQSFSDQVYPTALRLANDTQKEHLEAELQRHQIRTSR
ncbi:MAG: hypothetical protein JW953_20375 [Anaerolineae bacterium]|nr:hypothetical protein [Anaerolineae bacterium]